VERSITMAEAILRAGNTILPAPVSLSIADELIWSSDTGRTLSGKMVGDVVAEKKTVSISWGILTEAELVKIKNKLTKGFFPVTFRDDGGLITISVYRGTLTKEILGKLSDGVFYYKSATVDLVQQ
jgi:hypothetical protein